MQLLLDTNVFLKLAFDEKLPRKTSNLLSRPGNELLVSIITPWEIAIKAQRLGSKELTPIRVAEAMHLLGVRFLAIHLKHIATLSTLPPHHNDPFDRMLIAQAISEGHMLLSSDERFPLYRSVGLETMWD